MRAWLWNNPNMEVEATVEDRVGYKKIRIWAWNMANNTTSLIAANSLEVTFPDDILPETGLGVVGWAVYATAFGSPNEAVFMPMVWGGDKLYPLSGNIFMGVPTATLGTIIPNTSELLNLYIEFEIPSTKLSTGPIGNIPQSFPLGPTGDGGLTGDIGSTGATGV